MGLSPDEERHIQNLALIPFFLIFYVFLGYFVYLIRVNAKLSWSIFFAYIMFLFLAVFPVVYFTTLQVLRSRREKRPLVSYTKRFVGSMIIWITGGGIFGVVWFANSFFLSSIVNWSTFVIITFAVFVGIWGAVAFRFKNAFHNLSEGDW